MDNRHLLRMMHIHIWFSDIIEVHNNYRHNQLTLLYKEITVYRHKL